MRRSNWQLRFSAFVKERARLPFAWGTNDCCSFAAAAVEAVAGNNPMADLPAYDTEFSAMRLISEGGGLEQLVSARLGATVSPLLATVGDVVLLENEGRELLGVCNGTTAIAPQVAGIATLSMTAALAAWKI